MNLPGKLGESAAVEYLRKKGYRIVETNFRSRFGEIDIIAKNRKFLIFAEVKSRRIGALVSGLESVDGRKIMRIVATANYYLTNYKAKLQPRFDVITVEINEDVFKVSEHIENAF